jgi:hypothetical protein
VSNCTNCGAILAPNSRFCTECGKPVAAAPAPVPPQPFPPTARPPVGGQPGMPPFGGQQGMPPRPPVAPVSPAPQPGYMAPAPVAPAPAAPPVPPAQVVAQAAAAVAPPPAASGSALGAASGETIRSATVGDIFNDGTSVTVLVTENHLVILPSAGSARVEAIPGLRHAIIGDYDGDGTQDLMLLSDTQVWINRYSVLGAVSSGKVALQEVPEHLVRAPFTRDGQAVLMSTTAAKITFYIHHPARGLVEVGTTSVPSI